MDDRLNRRLLLKSAALTTGVAGFALGADSPEWMRKPGRSFSGYGARSRYEEGIVRKSILQPPRPPTSTRTPLQSLEGILTPSGLHFERHHNGVPEIDPAKHELIIHGMVKRPLAFTLETLMRYPMETHIRFIECSGNTNGVTGAQASQITAGEMHGLVSCSEWTGVKLSLLLNEAGVAPGAKWVIAEGADAAAMNRSVPLEKCMDDAVIALFQNGEAIRPEQGYPMRLLLPGFEGNTNVKWLRRLHLTSFPVDAREETSKYTMLQKDGRARQYMLPMSVKSIITRPSYGIDLKGGAGLHQITGLAWSGAGRIAKVEISTDGGARWQTAQLDTPVLPKAMTRFRLPWQWNGSPAVLMSRATDESGDVQPTREAWLRPYVPTSYHFNGIVGVSVDAQGVVKNVLV